MLTISSKSAVMASTSPTTISLFSSLVLSVSPAAGAACSSSMLMALSHFPDVYSLSKASCCLILWSHMVDLRAWLMSTLKDGATDVVEYGLFLRNAVLLLGGTVGSGMLSFATPVALV